MADMIQNPPQFQTMTPAPSPDQQPQPQPRPQASGFTMQPGRKKTVVRNAIIVGVLIAVLTGTVFSFDKARSFISKAEGGCFPENLNAANVTPNSAEIIFQTSKACQTAIAYGVSKDALLLQTEKESMASLNHRIRLSPLLPNSTYYYQVVFNNQKIGTQGSFLSKVTEGAKEEAGPTAVPTASTTTYTSQDFISRFGPVTAANKAFDMNKDGVVNSIDWKDYQKNNP